MKKTTVKDLLREWGEPDLLCEMNAQQIYDAMATDVKEKGLGFSDLVKKYSGKFGGELDREVVLEIAADADPEHTSDPLYKKSVARAKMIFDFMDLASQKMGDDELVKELKSKFKMSTKEAQLWVNRHTDTSMYEDKVIEGIEKRIKPGVKLLDAQGSPMVVKKIDPRRNVYLERHPGLGLEKFAMGFIVDLLDDGRWEIAEGKLDEAFSRQHYTAIGNILKKNNASEDMINAFADLFANDNPRFDRDYFLKFVLG